MIDRRWYALGKYMILAKPLDTNPYWTTHHIYLDGACIGRQLSVPCASDCDWHESRGRYENEYKPREPSRYEIFHTEHRPKRGPGRPRKSEAKPDRWKLEIPELA